MALLKADRLGVNLDGTALLEGVSFTLTKGSRLGLIGENGAGKSVLLRAIAGLLPQGATVTGSLSLDDTPMPAGVDGVRLPGRRVGVVLQNAADGFDPMQTIGAQIVEAAADATEALVSELLHDAGLEAALATRYPDQLDPGQRQRAMLAAALAGKPDLLLADDPVAGLDPIEQRSIVALIERLCAERQMTLVFAAHDLKLVALLATRVLVLKDGKVIESGDKAEIFGRPKHEHTRLLMTAGRHRARTLMRTPIGGVLVDVRKVGLRHRGPEPWPRGTPAVVLDDISLAIRQAESLALIGPRSAGKSSLARIVAGLERASSGELEFDHAIYHGADLPRLQRGGISFVFRDPRLSFNPGLTVGESIAEPLQLETQRLMDELGARIIEMLGAVGMSAEALARPPAEFSTTDLQCLALARALVTRPRLIVLNEPTAMLDVTARGAYAVMLNRLRADFGLTFLLVSDDLELVRTVADRVAVMDKGRIIEVGTPATLLERPQQPLTRELFAAALPDVGIVPVF